MCHVNRMTCIDTCHPQDDMYQYLSSWGGHVYLYIYMSFCIQYIVNHTVHYIIPILHSTLHINHNIVNLDSSLVTDRVLHRLCSAPLFSPDWSILWLMLLLHFHIHLFTLYLPHINLLLPLSILYSIRHVILAEPRCWAKHCLICYA